MKIMVYCDIPKLPLLNYDFLYVLRYHNLPSIRTIRTNIAILRCLKMTRGSADVLCRHNLPTIRTIGTNIAIIRLA